MCKNVQVLSELNHTEYMLFTILLLCISILLRISLFSNVRIVCKTILSLLLFNF